MQFGLSYRPTETSEILCDAYLTPHFKREIKMGLQFTPSSNLKLRAGTSDLTRMISAGCDIEWKNLSFLYSLNYHQLLGWTNSVGIEFKKLK
jgi:hypothetical protein